MAQAYAHHPVALERMAKGLCPECGHLPSAHDGWGGPACSLTDNGVAQRLHAYRKDQEAQPDG